MKLFRLLVLVNVLLIVQALNSELCRNDNPNRTDSIATALVTLLEKLSLRNAPLINVEFAGPLPCQHEFVFEKMMEKNRGKFLVQSFNGNIDWRDVEFQPYFAMMNCSYLEKQLNNSFSRPVVLYCPNLSTDELRRRVEQFSYEHPKGRNIKVLIEHEDKFIDLMSVVHFTVDQSRCRKSQLVRTNRFLLNEMRWQSNEFLQEPQRNFHGCELRVSVRARDSLDYYFENEDGAIETGGLLPDIMKATASASNFLIYFNAVGAQNKTNHKYIEGVEDDVDTEMNPEISSDFIIYSNVIFVIPRGELYSEASKLFMPLELEVWIASFITILIALLVIQIINRLSKEIQSFVFGRNVTTPSLNIMIAFVGGGQMILPGRSFARFLLILFIFFSLIIRTCYQSKLFTYLQSDFIKSEIQSIDEVIQRNLTVYVFGEDYKNIKSLNAFKNFIEYEENVTRMVAEMTLDPDFQGVVLTIDLTLKNIESQFRSDKAPLKYLKESLFGVFLQFPHKHGSFIKERINEVIGRLHSAGLINFWYDRDYELRNKQINESEPTPLTLNHLTVGFIVS